MKIFSNAVCPCFKAISFIKIEIMPTYQTAEYGSFRQDLGCAKDQNLGAGAQKWSGAPGKVFQVRQNIFKCA